MQFTSNTNAPMQTDIRILEFRPYFTREKARTPLKFGGVVMDSVLYCHVRAKVVNRGGKEAQGWIRPAQQRPDAFHA